MNSVYQTNYQLILKLRFPGPKRIQLNINFRFVTCFMSIYVFTSSILNTILLSYCRTIISWYLFRKVIGIQRRLESIDDIRHEYVETCAAFAYHNIYGNRCLRQILLLSYFYFLFLCFSLLLVASQ